MFWQTDWFQGGPPGAFPGGYGGAPGGYGGYGAPGYGGYGGYGYMDTQSPLDAEIQVGEFIITRDKLKTVIIASIFNAGLLKLP